MRGNSPIPSLLAGRPRAQLQADLAAAQQAYVDWQAGNKVESAAYTQGSGSRNVTYSAAEGERLQNLIRQLQRDLGLIARARAPIRPRFG